MLRCTPRTVHRVSTLRGEVLGRKRGIVQLRKKDYARLGGEGGAAQGRFNPSIAGETTMPIIDYFVLRKIFS